MEGNRKSMKAPRPRAISDSILSTFDDATESHGNQSTREIRGNFDMPFENTDQVDSQSGSQDTEPLFGKRPVLGHRQRRVSALTEAFQAGPSGYIPASSPPSSSYIPASSPPSSSYMPASSPPSSSPIPIKSSSDLLADQDFLDDEDFSDGEDISNDEDVLNEENIQFGLDLGYDKPSTGDKSEKMLRKWCSGLPPRRSYLGPRGVFPPKGRKLRRSTLPRNFMPDAMQPPTKIEYNGHLYLTLTAKVVHDLLPFFNATEPIAEMGAFERLIITHDTNNIHVDHAIAALERIGEYCKHLVVMSYTQTSELGNVFGRETGNLDSGSDWDHILECLPNLQRLAYVYLHGDPFGPIRATFTALSAAVTKRQAAQEVRSSEFNAPAGLITGRDIE